MVENLVQQVKSLEAEADALVEKARGVAAEIEQSAAAEAEALRGQFEEESRRDREAFLKEQQQRVADEQAELDKRAAAIAEALGAVAPEAGDEAIGLVLKHLREG